MKYKKLHNKAFPKKSLYKQINNKSVATKNIDIDIKSKLFKLNVISYSSKGFRST